MSARHATLKPPVPPASLRSGIPWRRLIGASLADALRIVMKQVFMQIEAEGFPDARLLVFQVDPREAAAAQLPLILPESAWAWWAARGEREPLEFQLHGAHQHAGEDVQPNFRHLRCTPAGLHAAFSFSDDPKAPDWQPVAIPWGCLVGMRDGWAGVTLVVQDRAIWDRDEPAVAGSEEEQAAQEPEVGGRWESEARKAEELRRAAAAFRTLDVDPKKAH